VLDALQYDMGSGQRAYLPRTRNEKIEMLKPNGGAHGEKHLTVAATVVDLVPRLAGVGASRRRN
jgi:hypothetical protein